MAGQSGSKEHKNTYDNYNANHPDFKGEICRNILFSQEIALVPHEKDVYNGQRSAKGGQ